MSSRNLKMNIYKAKFKALCPNDENIVDTYKVKIHTNKIIMVEDISLYLSGFEKKAIYQENLTEQILENFQCNKVVLIGKHIGVKIKSITK